MCLCVCVFADDAAAFTTSRAAYETSAECFVSCAAAWGLIVSVTKTKGMSINSPRNDPVPTSAGEMSSVDSFTYLGSIIHRDGLSSHDVAARIAKASRAFGSLRAAVFENGSLSLRCRRSVYIAVVLSTLLYGSEVWTLKAADVRQLTMFHRQCIRVIVGVTRRWQWDDHITSEQLATALRVSPDIGTYIRERRLRWLGHVGRIDDCRLPKGVLFGELDPVRPRHGPRKRWRDITVDDLAHIKPPVAIAEWYGLAQDRKEWRAIAHRPYALEPASLGSFPCSCGREFPRSGDLKRHEKYCHVRRR